MRASPIPQKESGQSYDKLVRMNTSLTQEKAILLGEIQSLRRLSQSRSNEASPSLGGDSTDGPALTKLLEENLRSGTLACLFAIKGHLKRTVAMAFLKWKGKVDMAGLKDHYEMKIEALKRELNNKPDDGENPWKNTAMTLLARQRKEEKRAFSRSPTRGRSKDRAGYGLSGAELHAHRKPWGSREGERNKTAVSGTSAYAWKKNPTSPRSRDNYAHYRRANAGSPSSLRSGSSSSFFAYNHSSSFPRALNEAESLSMHHVHHGMDEVVVQATLSGSEEHKDKDGDGSGGKPGKPGSGLMIEIAAHGGSVHEREERDLSSLHKHIRKHDTHHDTHAHEDSHSSSTHAMDTRSRTDQSAEGQGGRQGRSQSSPPSPRYLNHTANFKNSTYNYYSHNERHVPDFYLHQPSSPSEMQEYIASVGAQRREMNRRSRSPAGSPVNVTGGTSFGFGADDYGEGNSIGGSSNFSHKHHFASSKSKPKAAGTYRRNQTDGFNDYGKPKFVSPTRRSRSADSARRAVTGAARNMTSPMLNPAMHVSQGRTQSIKRMGQQVYNATARSRAVETTDSFGGIPSYMTPTFSSKHMTKSKDDTLKVQKQHRHELIVKRQQDQKMDRSSKKRASDPHMHFGYDLDARYEDEEPPRMRTNGSTSTKSVSSKTSQKGADSGAADGAPRFMRETLSVRGSAKDEELRARIRAQHDKEHSTVHSTTYSKEHANGKNFVYANSEHLPLLSRENSISVGQGVGGTHRSGSGSQGSERDAEGEVEPTSSDDEAQVSSAKHVPPAADGAHTEPVSASVKVSPAPAPSAEGKVAARMAKLKKKQEQPSDNGRDSSGGNIDREALVNAIAEEATEAMKEIDSIVH